MKYIGRLLICLMFATCSFMACDKKDRINVDKNGKVYPVYIYKGSKWDILQINDSIITMIPGLNGSDNIKPVVININNLKSNENLENVMSE